MPIMKPAHAFSILVLTACSDSGQVTVASGAPTTSASSSAAAAAGLTNPTCLSYLEKTKVCIAKAPDGEREARTKAITEIEKMWNEQSKTADGRKRLEASCGAALKQFEETGSCQTSDERKP